MNSRVLVSCWRISGFALAGVVILSGCGGSAANSTVQGNVAIAEEDVSGLENNATVPLTVNDTNFETVVLDNDKPVVVAFGAIWCQACHWVPEFLRKFDTKQDALVIAKLDVDVSPTVAQSQGIESLPTFNVYKNGKLVKSIVGPRDEKQLSDELAEFTTK